MSPKSLARPILVTGAHRTGTTWVGKMLAAGGQTAYISEPLNVLHRPGVLKTPVQYWYTYIHAGNEAEFLPGLQETISYRYHLRRELSSIGRSLSAGRSSSAHPGKDLARMGRDAYIFLRGRIMRQTPLLKDPFAIFSAPWFARRLGCRIVITIRHPAAFASSLKRLDWPFDFADLLAQQQLMQDWLEPFRQDIEAMATPGQDNTTKTIASASLLWLVIYTFVKQCLEHNPDFILVRHEDLSTDPVKGFETLYSRLGLVFSSQTEKKVQKASSSENPGELTRNATHSVHLNSRANLHNWKRRLTPEEIQSIRHLTGNLCQFFYPDQTWD
jgi:hypothetical protein